MTQNIMTTLSIIIPVFNQKNSIQALIKKIEAIPTVSKQIIIVDDASVDGTSDGLKAIETEKINSPEYIFIYHSIHRGKGVAIRTAQPLVNGEVVMLHDKEYLDNPNDYLTLIQPVLSGSSDAVYGIISNASPKKRFLYLLSNFLTNVNIKHLDAPYRVFSRFFFRLLPLTTHKYGFDLEIIAKLAKMGCRIKEIPVNSSGKVDMNNTKSILKENFYSFFTILKYFFVDDTDKKPYGYSSLLSVHRIESYYRFLFELIKPFLGNTILEIGAGIGKLSKFLSLKDSMIYITDTNEEYLSFPKNLHKNNPNVKVFCYDIEHEMTQNINKIDTLICFNVLEHLRNDDKVLLHLYNILEHQGTLMLLVPAHKCLYNSLDGAFGHYRRYSKMTIISKIKNFGFEIVKVRYINLPGAIGWFINGKILKRSYLPSSQARFFYLIKPWLFIEKYIPMPYGSSLLVVARKT